MLGQGFEVPMPPRRPAWTPPPPGPPDPNARTRQLTLFAIAGVLGGVWAGHVAWREISALELTDGQRRSVAIYGISTVVIGAVAYALHIDMKYLMPEQAAEALVEAAR